MEAFKLRYIEDDANAGCVILNLVINGPDFTLPYSQDVQKLTKSDSCRCANLNGFRNRGNFIRP